jgi:glycosyltransferase involved in cell wall biosynthesis
MRIAMIGPFGFHPNKTMRSRALQLARRLVERGHSVKIFMPPWQTPEEEGKTWQENGVEIQYTGTGGGYLGRATSLTRQVINWNPEVAHSFKPKAYSGLASWWLWYFHRSRIKSVTDSDDWEGTGGWNEVAPYSAAQKRFFDWQENWGLRHNHALTVASRELESRARAIGLPDDKVFYLPNGPGISSLSNGESQKRAELSLIGRPVILLYSRLFEFDTARLVGILSQVKDALPDLAVLTVGMSLFESDAVDFKEAVAKAELEDAIVDVGWVEEEELPFYLRAADAGVYLIDDNLINRSKCPVKLADMLSVGLPVVAENVGQVPEYVIQDKTGLLRKSGDSAGIASDLVAMLGDSKLRERLSQGAQELIEERFSWDRLADTAEEAYQFALQTKK